ncbi:hypothetical protein LCGC14_1340680 [marine sediment metagenome]|uniref:Uncharacterized protein n=1 Tax=marine sediment metagenome TaxID=412755 RepID=A0A0F9MUQ7_9ZZZZ
MALNRKYYLHLKNRQDQYDTYKVAEAVYIYVRQLEIQVKILNKLTTEKERFKAKEKFYKVEKSNVPESKEKI